MFSRIKQHIIPLIFFILNTGFLTGQQVKSHRYVFEGSSGKVEIVNTGRHGFTLTYNTPELTIYSDGTAGGGYYRLYIPGHGMSSETGKPEMPVYSKLISIPEQAVPVVKIRDVKTRFIYPTRNNFRGMVFPRQIEMPKNWNRQQNGLQIDRVIYNKKDFIAHDTVMIEYIGKIRDNELSVLQIRPVRYNPGKNILEIITSMTVEVDFTGEKIDNPLKSEESFPFIQTLSKGILNYSEDNLITGYSEDPVKMIIISDTVFRKILRPYIRWKTQKGFTVTTLYKGAGLAGNSFTELKDTLGKIYFSEKLKGSAPQYLLLVGDVNRIPVSETPTNYTDLYYTTFDGTGDYLPEMFTGRLPVADTNELKSVLKKLIQYEKFEFADTNRFYNRTLATAGNDAVYANFMNGQLKYAEKYYLNESNKIKNYIFYYPQSINARDSIIKLLNLGLGFVNYSGHGDAYGWLSPLFKSVDVVQLTNKNMYPFVISNACRTGMYHIAGSFGNTLIKTDEKGAAGFIGASNDSYWTEDYYWSVGIGPVSNDPKYEETSLAAYDRLFHKFGEKASDWYITMGQIIFAGNLSVTASPSSKKKYYWEIYNLLGDPSIIPYMGTPDTFKINLPDILPNKIRSLSLTINPHSYIAVSKSDTLWDASYASPSGSVTLDIPERSNDSCLVVITGQNKVPLIKKIYISGISNEFINLTKTEINDQLGNNNGKADYGERIYFKLTISNLGLTPATELYVKISPVTPGLFTVLNDSVYIGNLNSQSEIVLSNQLLLKINEYILDRRYITLNVKIKSTTAEKNYIKDIRLHAPVLELLNCTVNDIASGNGNMIAEPGETLDLIIKIKNHGSSSTAGNIVVNDQSAGMVVHSPVIPTGTLNPGEIKSIAIPVTISPLLNESNTLYINVTADCSPYFVNKVFTVYLGKTRESFEYENFNMFPWNNSYANPWIITSDQAFEGYFSARSGQISHNQESKLSLKVNIPYSDTLSFMYKVSSERNYDFLILNNNGKEFFKASGETNWLERKIKLTEGFNNLEWNYRKDGSVTAGQDCAWIDFLKFPVGAFNKIDLKTGKILTPEAGKKLGQETISALIINLGTDTIKKFNYAYTVNNRLPVTETFIRTIRPGDTTSVSFAVKADLSAGGTYVLKVYGFNNNDSYQFNDTASVTIINTSIDDILNPESGLRVMPNPFSDMVSISFNANSYESANITIINITGNTVWEERREIIPGNNLMTIIPRGLTPGYYTLKVSGKTIFKTLRIIKSQ